MATFTYLVKDVNFQAIQRREKKSEFIKLNKNVNVGDSLELVEVSNDNGRLRDTGNLLTCKITHIQYGGEYGIPEDRMIMSIEII